MTQHTIEISVKGRWFKVPAMNVGGNSLAVSGKWIKVAAVHDEDWLENEVENPELYIGKLREHASYGLRADIFTFTQKVPAVRPKYPYPFEWESIAAIALTTFKQWWEKLPQETRKNVRRAEKRGVVVRVQEFNDELIRGIVEVNNESPLRQGRRFTHYGKTFDQVKKDHGAFLDRSDFICAYCGDELIGFLKLVYRGHVASVLQLLPKARHHDKRPANALIAKAVELCEARGVGHLTYGLFNYGNKRNTPIQEFKSRNGFGELLMPRFYIPLTAWGTICIKMKLHRGLLGILPNRLIAVGLDLRGKWYNFKH